MLHCSFLKCALPQVWTNKCRFGGYNTHNALSCCYRSLGQAQRRYCQYFQKVLSSPQVRPRAQRIKLSRVVFSAYESVFAAGRGQHPGGHTFHGPSLVAATSSKPTISFGLSGAVWCDRPWVLHIRLSHVTSRACKVMFAARRGHQIGVGRILLNLSCMLGQKHWQGFVCCQQGCCAGEPFHEKSDTCLLASSRQFQEARISPAVL